jgi:hypothetical protein
MGGKTKAGKYFNRPVLKGKQTNILVSICSLIHVLLDNTYKEK